MKLEMTDDAGHFWLDGKLYKIKRYLRGTREEALKGIHKAEYIEVNPEDYDSRINKLAQRIANFPKVDLLDIVKDALYDMALAHLDTLEQKLNKEEAKAKAAHRQPEVKTKRGARGTCVELRIGDKYGMELRI